MLFGTLLLSPGFLQELLGYSAWKAGLVQAPRGMGSMTSMMLVGNLARFGIDTRKFIGLGFTLITIGCWYSARFNLQVGMWEIIWPTVVMGLGFGMIFIRTASIRIRGTRRSRRWIALKRRKHHSPTFAL